MKNPILNAYRAATAGMDFEDRIKVTQRWDIALRNNYDFTTHNEEIPEATDDEYRIAMNTLTRLLKFAIWVLDDPKPWVSSRGVRYGTGDIFTGTDLTLDPRLKYLLSRWDNAAPTCTSDVANPTPDATIPTDKLAELAEVTARGLNAWDSQAEHDALEHIAELLGLTKDTATEQWAAPAPVAPAPSWSSTRTGRLPTS